MESSPYVVRFSDKKATGIAYNILKVIFESIHVKFSLLPTKRAYLLELIHNFTLTSVLEDMKGLQYFAVLGPTPYNIWKKDLVDFMGYTMQDQLVWIFPATKPIPKWIFYVEPFTAQLWVYNTLLLVFMTIVFVMLKKRGYDSKLFRMQKIKLFFDMFSINIGKLGIQIMDFTIFMIPSWR